MPDFYFVLIKIEKQCELFLPCSSRNEEIFMDFLFGIRRVAENVLTKQNDYINLFYWFVIFSILIS